jgi:DNA-binding protein HU-beta
MNQGDLADAVAEATGAKKAEAARVVEAVLDAIRDGLKRGEKVSIRGFGEFEAARRGPRKGRNIRTGETIDVAPVTLVKFRPGKSLKDALNGGGALAARFSR